MRGRTFGIGNRKRKPIMVVASQEHAGRDEGVG